MSEAQGEDAGRRPLLNRIGIVTLNLLGPGLGLLRIRRLRAAIALLLVPHVLIGLVILVFALTPSLGFWAWMAIAGIALALLLVAYSVAMGMSWRASRPLQSPGPGWSRGYGILLVAAANFGVNWVEADIARSFCRAFYVASESMLPTLRVNDGFLASMRAPDQLRRGDLVLVEADRGAIYISRVAALPGDRIALVGGVVFLNGRAVPQRRIGVESLPRDEVRGGPAERTRLAEHFPGEAAPHEIYDQGYTAGDDFSQIAVPPGHLFVLGDNRDNAADSRYSRRDMGLELVRVERVRGQPLYHSWRSSRPMGAPVNHPE